ncbi:MAG: glutamyl-tRNA reductase [Sedimentisphaerales bacterium]|nr:glutamyl-tRNA reductase [Sedimentisphaerales bacterium]
MKIILTGLNHKTAPIQIREQLAFDNTQITTAVSQLKQRFPQSEFVLLSTCNRVELYSATQRRQGLTADNLVKFFAEFHNLEPAAFHQFLYIHENADAVRHLLTVASSLDSMVLGEDQIISQVKESYSLACQAKTTSKVLNRLFHCAFATSKEVCNNTLIAQGHISVAGVAVDLANQLFPDIRFADIIVIGAGDMGRLLLQRLVSNNCQNVKLINRSYEHALKIANRYPVQPQPWESLNQHLVSADIVIASSGSREYLFNRESFAQITKQRSKPNLLIIDIAVPRNFDPSIADIPNVHLYSIDQLSSVAEQNRQARADDVISAMEIIEKNTTAFLEWFNTRDLGPLIGQMKQTFAQITEKELELFLSKTLQNAPCREIAQTGQNLICRDLAQSMAHRIVNKLLHCVIQNLNTIAQTQGPAEAVKLLDQIVQQAQELSTESTDKQ